VKNNLQIIASFFKMESRRVDHERTRAVLRDMQGRIQSMALLHETLYQSGKFSRVDLSVYLRQLMLQLFRSLVNGPQIDLHLELASVLLEIDQAIPCGLILNELASNSLKHGFPDGRAGDVWVELVQNPDDREVTLRVRDSGVGLPADFEWWQKSSLGLNLVSNLARQLQGKLTVVSGASAAFEVRFVPATLSSEIPPAKVDPAIMARSNNEGDPS
jgi:two-component sensor histidine kinase